MARNHANCDIASKTVTAVFIEHWIARFGVSAVITTDQGRQFMSSLFSSLISSLGMHHIRTTPYHSINNGLVERFHRSLKQSLKCHQHVKWTEKFPLILLGLLSAFKEDLQCTVAELHGSSIRSPGEFISPVNKTIYQQEFLQRLRENIH